MTRAQIRAAVERAERRLAGLDPYGDLSLETLESQVRGAEETLRWLKAELRRKREMGRAR